MKTNFQKYFNVELMQLYQNNIFLLVVVVSGGWGDDALYAFYVAVGLDDLLVIRIFSDREPQTCSYIVPRCHFFHVSTALQESTKNKNITRA